MTVEAAEHEPTTADRTVRETVPGPFDAALARLGAIQGDALERGTVGFDGFRGQAFEDKLERKRRYGEVFTLAAANHGYLFRLELPRRVPPSALKDQLGIADDMPPYACEIAVRDGFIVVAGHVVDPAVRKLAAFSPAFPPDFTTRVRLPGAVTTLTHRIHDRTVEIVLLKD